MSIVSVASRVVRVAGRRTIVVLVTATVLVSCHDAPTGPSSERDATAGTWQAWTFASAAELRPAAPASRGSVDVARELDDIVRLQGARTPATDSAVRRWSGSPTAPWDSAALHVLDFYFPLLPDVRVATPVRAARAMALLHVAMYDAMIATWDAKYAYRRESPAAVDSRVVALIDAGGVPSYPSEHAAVAEAAAVVLSYAFPAEDTLRFHLMAREAGDARVAGGAAFRSDVEAGAAIGRAVAARVIALARTDGSAEVWNGVRPVGPDLWRPTPNKFVQVPFDANSGQWRTWVLPSASVFRPAPPPAVGSATFSANLDELRTLSTGRTIAQADMARYWATDAPSVIWEKYMLEEIAQRGLSPVRAARAQALASVAMYDAFLACWDAKFYYWLERPVSAEPALRTVFPTPPFPSYPSGHSTISSAAGEVFAELFPDKAQHYRDIAVDASLSRVYAGVHYRFDVEAGDALGVQVGRSVVQHARGDGSAR
ncbi:MAG: phosphatase PAP2 family protein [Gemmatimonadaceae bacterium]